MKILQTLVTILLSVGVTLAVVSVREPTMQGEAKAKETRLERIKRTGVLRCGYSIWPPGMTRDPNTGAFGGIFYDLMEEIGKQIGVKIEWTTEAQPAHMFADLDNDRYDMVCSSYIPTPARAMAGGFTTPIFYNTNYLYARADDTRFDHNYDAADNASVSFAVVDGGLSSLLADKKFPHAKKPALSEYATPADMYLAVADNKADLVISEPLSFALFTKSHPGKLKQVSGQPLTIYGAGMPLPAKEYDLKNTMDATLAYLQGSGFVDSIFTKYETEGARTLRLAKPYVLSP